MKKRIWELDTLRGLCVLGMVLVHFIFNLVEMYGLIDWEYPVWFVLVKEWGGLLFLLISGICVTLGSHPVRRGILVFFCGLICTAVTYGMVALNFADNSMIIWFGVLHCLGVCMLLWPAFSRLPVWLVAVLGVVLMGLGFYFVYGVKVDTWLLVPFGLTFPAFATPDYFPLLPYLGLFLLGAALGKTLYKNKTTLFPNINPKNPVIVFFSQLGRYSLWIYLLHQPVLSVLCLGLSYLQ